MPWIPDCRPQAGQRDAPNEVSAIIILCAAFFCAAEIAILVSHDQFLCCCFGFLLLTNANLTKNNVTKTRLNKIQP
jgi:hypothetical protein